MDRPRVSPVCYSDIAPNLAKDMAALFLTKTGSGNPGTLCLPHSTVCALQLSHGIDAKAQRAQDNDWRRQETMAGNVTA